MLSDLALRSKGHWGYSKEFLARCRDELTVTPDDLRDTRYWCYVAVKGETIVGYYALRPDTQKSLELDALFVEPIHIGQGIGKVLIEHALGKAADLGRTRVTIQGDPNATAFYLSVGALQIGERESASIPGRLLPLFEIRTP